MHKKEYIELLDFIDENNGWAESYYREHKAGIPLVKYVKTSYDTRDYDIWWILLAVGGKDVVFAHQNCDLINIKNYLQGKEAEYTVERR